MLARDHAWAATPQVSGVVFVIVGTLSMPAGMRVWIDNGHDLRLAVGLDCQSL